MYCIVSCFNLIAWVFSSSTCMIPLMWMLLLMAVLKARFSLHSSLFSLEVRSHRMPTKCFLIGPRGSWTHPETFGRHVGASWLLFRASWGSRPLSITKLQPFWTENEIKIKHKSSKNNKSIDSKSNSLIRDRFLNDFASKCYQFWNKNEITRLSNFRLTQRHRKCWNVHRPICFYSCFKIRTSMQTKNWNVNLIQKRSWVQTFIVNQCCNNCCIIFVSNIDSK